MSYKDKDKQAAADKRYYDAHKEERAKTNKKYRDAHKEEIAKRKRKYNQKHKEEIAKRNRKYRQENKEEIAKSMRKYRQEHKEEIAENDKKYRQEHKEEIAKRNLEYQKKRYKTDPEFRLLCNLRNRIRRVLKGTSKSARTIELLGAPIEKVREHLESQFTEGMSWDNYGLWHHDHIIPCAHFDLTDPEQQRKCFHYTNLQPLWAEDNMRKGSTLKEC